MLFAQKCHLKATVIPLLISSTSKQTKFSIKYFNLNIYTNSLQSLIVDRCEAHVF